MLGVAISVAGRTPMSTFLAQEQPIEEDRGGVVPFVAPVGFSPACCDFASSGVSPGMRASSVSLAVGAGQRAGLQ